MTCTPEQVKKLMQYRQIHTQETAAAKAGMSLRSARSYLKGKPIRRSLQRSYRTRKDPFAEAWDDIKKMLSKDPGLEARTLLEWLIDREPAKYSLQSLRTMQRRVREWRALEGPEKQVFFSQKLQPGRQSQSDYTHCTELKVTIKGAAFPHMLFHFMLPYSRWETAYIAHSESFQTLSEGYTNAVRELGAIAEEHRTDNLAAAVPIGKRKEFQRRWKEFLSHYGAYPSANNPGESHENGSVEKSHDLLKHALEQRLKLRGSTDFPSVEAYEDFVRSVLARRNRERKQKLAEELRHMKSLPARDYSDPKELVVGVSPFSTVVVLRSTYSVPSRLIGMKLRALVFAETVDLFYGKQHIQSMRRLRPGESCINYRHVITHLVRKPRAFAHYKYRDDLFPSKTFREAYDRLKEEMRSDGEKQYLRILNIAALNGESVVEHAVQILMEYGELPNEERVRELIRDVRQELPQVSVATPELAQYDTLLLEYRP